MSVLSFCSCSFCCGVQLFHIEIMQLNEIFGGNEFDNRFFDGCLRANLNKFCFKKVLQHTVPKRDLYISLTSLKKLSLLAWLDLEKAIRDILPCLNLKLVFKIKDRLSFKFTIRDKISKEMRSLICYKFPCSSCNATYYGKTKRCFKVVSLNIRESLHLQVKASSLPRILLCVIISWFVITLCLLGTFLFLLMEPMIFGMELRESLWIDRDGPQLRKISESIPLMFFLLGRVIFVAWRRCIALLSPLMSNCWVCLYI